MDVISQRQHRWEQQLAQACEDYSRRLFLLSYNIVHDRDVAEDMCQQALTRACERRIGLDNPARLRAWLARVVINESLAWLRHRKVEQRHRDAVATVDTYQSDVPGQRELREQTLMAVAELPEKLQVVVLLRVMQGLSGNEVSQLLECSAAEVSRRLYRGMEHLRQRLAPHVTGSC